MLFLFMAKAKRLKDIYTKSYLNHLGQAIKKYYPAFSVSHFYKLVTEGNWKSLELKGRIRKISSIMGKKLPQNYKEALCIVIQASREGFNGYEAGFFPDFVEVHGLHPRDEKESLRALKIMTQYSSSEFAFRPFLIRDLKTHMNTLAKWSQNSNYHIRRLSSECCRPRLPWAKHLTSLQKNPQLIWPILENLKTDESLYVRRSVANNLNDISKDHPQRVIEKAKKWMGHHPHTDWIVKHGLRTLLKQGNKQALKICGYSYSRSLSLKKLSLQESQIFIGQRLKFQGQVKTSRPTLLRLEYALYFLRQRGSYTRKVFKISEKKVPRGVHTLKGQHSFKLINTRKYYPGPHKVALIINGREQKTYPFQLNSPYWVYMVRTQKKKLYTGISTDPERRFREHRESKSKGAKYFRSDPPLKIVYQEIIGSRSEALKREAYIKGLNSQQKELFLHSHSSR